MKKIIFLFFLMISGYCQAQNESNNSRQVVTSIEKFYNLQQYDSIFALFSAEMQQSLPLEKTIAFFSGLYSQAGAINKRSFIKYRKTYACYKTNFEHALFSLEISTTDQSLINGLFVKPFKDETITVPARNSVKLSLPFKEEWTVIWGGDTKEQNYHIESEAQKNAFDMVIQDANGKSYKTDGKSNDDYYAFGKQLTSPTDAEVVLVVDGVQDNVPGELNPVYVPGNTVILRIAKDEYILFAHFKQHSIVVKEGEKVKKGQLLGLCGNSGNSSEAHLHFHIQHTSNMVTATGIKCYFDELLVNGKKQTDYSPVQKDRIKP